MRKLTLSLLVVLTMIGTVVAQQRKVHSLPTYTFEIRGEDWAEAEVTIEGKLFEPESRGGMKPIKKYTTKLPTTFYTDADLFTELRITSEKLRFRVVIFYEHNNISKELFSKVANPGADLGMTIKLKPYKE